MPERVDVVQDLFSLDGRVTLITGGAGLLGRRYCEALVQAGGRVIIGDLDGGRAEALASEIDPTRTIGVRLDVTDPDSVDACVTAGVDAFGRLDILVNNAALTVRGGSENLSPADYFAPFEEYSLEVW